jgi:hypothetical protein
MVELRHQHQIQLLAMCGVRLLPLNVENMLLSIPLSSHSSFPLTLIGTNTLASGWSMQHYFRLSSDLWIRFP